MKGEGKGRVRVWVKDTAREEGRAWARVMVRVGGIVWVQHG